MSLRLRSIAAAAAATMIAVIVLGLAVDVLVARHLHHAQDNTLRARAVEVAQLAASAPALLTTPGSLDSPTNELEKKMRDEIACTCGGCAHEPLSKCICGQAAQMREDLRADIDAGKSHDQIISEWITKFGGEQFLSMPIDRGFNRVAWIFPYLLGGLGVFGVGFVAMRWSKHSHEAPLAEKSPEDAAMNERLDDELRNLD